ncbi:MAG: 3-hydroxyacyl-CoA dehydrogenase family protein [Thermoleophilia bacterium]|nr:3-hydroxyacyl-CoA dehydrogenase family protein [Thermoleophilia bacterium]
MSENPYPEMAIAGSGAIATGLASLASVSSGTVWLLARSARSAEAAMAGVAQSCDRIEGADVSRVRATTDPGDVGDSGLVVEAIIEDLDAKTTLLATAGAAAPGADLATTTSSLSVAGLGLASGHERRLFGLHVFNPVPVMNLVELCLPDSLDDEVAGRALDWCARIGKTAVEVPDTPGFVVNRLLFPYLFDAVRLQERTAMPAADVDTCMTLGVAHPLGPLALLDLIGLDVALAIGDALHADSGNSDHQPPAVIAEKIAAGDLGRKSGRGFYDYD